MSRIVSTLRIAALLALAAAAVAGILSLPADTSATWLPDLLIGKALGIAAALAYHRLYCRWSVADPWLAAYHAWQARGIRGQL